MDALETPHARAMRRMFAAVGDLYATWWHDWFHFALFEGDEPWEEAYRRTHARYLADLRAADARHVLELACGRGGFAAVLAEHTRGDVLAIDISEAQLARARRHRLSNLRFVQHDVMRVHELGGPYDAVSFMDAACYLPDKALAIERIARVMAPGGRLLLIDWCRQEGLNFVQQELVLEPFMRLWAIPSLETGEGYTRHLSQHFRILAAEDLNHRTRRNWDYGYERALEAVQAATVAKLPPLVWKGMRLGAEGIRLIKEQFPAALYIKAGFDAGFLRYKYFLCERR
ncbi:MAG: SAM-dependent methyltransferase [Myxococcota bacterium]